MVNTVCFNADQYSNADFHPLADHTTKLRNFTTEEYHGFSAFKFSRTNGGNMTLKRTRTMCVYIIYSYTIV